MATRYIYLSDDLNEMLKKEDSASSLISRLLTKYYDEKKNSEIEKEKESNKEREKEAERERIKAVLIEKKGREPTEKELNETIEYCERVEERFKNRHPEA